LKRWAETAYRATVRAQACDVLRSYLPAATLTNVGMFGAGQAFEYLISKLYSHDVSEAQALGAAIHGELNQLIPSFVKRAQRMTTSDLRRRRPGAHVRRNRPATKRWLVDYEWMRKRKSSRRCSTPGAPAFTLRKSPQMSPRSAANFPEYFSKRRHRRIGLPRFENVYYTFDILGNLGLYRDLQRHRILTQERQEFTTVHGYDTPPEIEEGGFKGEFDHCMERAAQLYEQIYRDLPCEAQYVVPFAYKIRWYMKMNLREALHMCELRTMPQGHPDYRFICQEIWRKIQSVHPALAEAGRFIDWKKYRLGACSRRCARSLEVGAEK
jgi:thymidylate synthase ThyX